MPLVRSAGVSSVEPVVNPGVREARRQRLIRMTKEQIAGRTGPVRQVRYGDEVVSPLALELECRKLLLRAQRAIATVVASGVYAGDLRGTVRGGGGPVLAEVAVGVRPGLVAAVRGDIPRPTPPAAWPEPARSQAAGRLGNEISETSRSTFSTIS
jgi:hypothetical protein